MKCCVASGSSARVWRALVAIALLLIVCCVPRYALATVLTCTLTSITPVSPNVATSTFGRDAPVGSTSPAYSTTLSWHCPGDPCCDRDAYVYVRPSPSTLVAGFNDVYPTNVPGVGVRFNVINVAPTKCQTLPATVKNGSLQVYCHQIVAALTPGYDFTIEFDAIFVKTGAVTSGPLTTIPTVAITGALNNQGDSWPWGNAFTGSASGSFASIACSVTQSNVKVDMPQANTRNLQSVGATTGATAFALSLDCDAGVQVAVTLTDATTPSNRSTTLTLTPESTARGIGYQIAFSGTPVAFGPDSAVPGNAGQIVVTASPTVPGTLSVPMSASYIRTGAVTPGSANAKATFTMSYQ